MRVWSVPARYSAELEAAVGRAVDLIRIDVYRRENGHPPVIPDFAILPDRTEDVFVVVGVASDRLATAVGKAVEQSRDSRRKRPA